MYHREKNSMQIKNELNRLLSEAMLCKVAAHMQQASYKTMIVNYLT